MAEHSCPANAYGLKPEVGGRVVPHPRLELQVDPARAPQAQGLDQPGALPKGLLPKGTDRKTMVLIKWLKCILKQPNAKYHGEQGYNAEHLMGIHWAMSAECYPSKHFCPCPVFLFLTWQTVGRHCMVDARKAFQDLLVKPAWPCSVGFVVYGQCKSSGNYKYPYDILWYCLNII